MLSKGDREGVEELFERADAEASQTVIEMAGRVRKGGALMLKGQPCKVIDVPSATVRHLLFCSGLADALARPFILPLAHTLQGDRSGHIPKWEAWGHQMSFHWPG